MEYKVEETEILNQFPDIKLHEIYKNRICLSISQLKFILSRSNDYFIKLCKKQLKAKANHSLDFYDVFNIIYTAYQVDGRCPDIVVDDNDYEDPNEEEDKNDLNESVFTFKNIINEKSKEKEKFKNALKNKIGENAMMINIENMKKKMKEFERRLINIENKMNISAKK